MPKKKIKQLNKEIRPYLNKIKPFIKLLVELVKNGYNKVASYTKSKITSWWQVVLIFIFCIVFLYYPLGGLLIHKIDTSNDFQPHTADGRLASIDTMSYLINREVHHKLWTPSLPFLFPSYILDNMPSFQLGIMSSVSTFAQAIDSLHLSKANDTARKNLTEGTKLLQYPGNIWLFSQKNKLLPTPSSNTQYKKGRKKYNIFNNEIALGNAVLDRTPENLLLIMLITKKDFENTISKTENHIREKSTNLIDFSSDNVFYYEKGKLYAYSQLLKSLSHDFKDAMIRYDIYQQWTSILSTLDEAGMFDSLIIRNARPNSSISPNHLVAINYLAAKALNNINNIIIKLEKQASSK